MEEPNVLTWLWCGLPRLPLWQAARQRDTDAKANALPDLVK